MEISLAGRSAVVTGGSKGIGFAVATRFAKSGADVAIVARGREALDAAVKAVGAGTNSRVVGVQGDVANAADVSSGSSYRARCGASRGVKPRSGRPSGTCGGSPCG